MRKVMFDVTNAHRIRQLDTRVLEHVIHVEAEAVARRRDASIDDVQTQLIEDRRRAGEAMPARSRKYQHRGGAANTVRVESYQRLIGADIPLRQEGIVLKRRWLPVPCVTAKRPAALKGNVG